MKPKAISILGLGLVFTFLCLTLQSPAKKPVKPGDEDPPTVDSLTFELINLGTIPGATSAHVTGINNVGSVVGYFGIDGDAQAFVIEAVDGYYGPILLIGPADDSFATDINAWGVVTTGESESNEPDRAVLWVDGNPIVLAEGPGARADGVNDLVMPLTWGYDVFESYRAIDIKNDYRTLVTFNAGYDPYEIFPVDSSGTYLWYTDTNGDFFNDLMVIFEGGANRSIAAANEVGNAVGRVGDFAAMWESYSTTSYINLGALSRKDVSSASDINDALWAVGISSGRTGTKGFLYKDGEMKDFGELCGNATAYPAKINNAGIVAGNIGPDVFVAIPSEAP